MKKTIQKVLAELKTEKPDLSYIRGLLEGLVEEEAIPFTHTTTYYTTPLPTIAGATTSDPLLDPNNPLSSKWSPDPTEQAMKELEKFNNEKLDNK